MNRRSRRLGFSLVELLVVIAIIGIFAAVFFVGGRALLDRSRLSNALSTITTSIDDARLTAKRTDSTITVTLTEADGAWTVSYGTRSKALPARVEVTSGATSLRLDPPFGTFAGATESIALAIGGAERTVTVTGVLARTVVHP